MRLFIAASLPAEHIQAICTTGEHLRRLREVKAAAPEAMHMTLLFLGERDEQNLPDIIEAMEESIAGIGAVEAAYRGITAFPSPRNPRVIVVPVHQGAEELREIHQALQRRLSGDDRKRFSPHITLGRVKGAPGALLRELENPAYVREPAGACTIDSITLYQSVLHPAGPRYTKLAERNLRK